MHVIANCLRVNMVVQQRHFYPSKKVSSNAYGEALSRNSVQGFVIQEINIHR